MTVSLLISRTLQDAIDTASVDWKWNYVGGLRPEFSRPDTREIIRFIPDLPDALRGLAWATTVYLGRDWGKRSDADTIKAFLDSGFFREGDPVLPPPRPRRSRDDKLSEIRQQLTRLEKP